MKKLLTFNACSYIRKCKEKSVKSIGFIKIFCVVSPGKY